LVNYICYIIERNKFRKTKKAELKFMRRKAGYNGLNDSKNEVIVE